MKWLMSLLLLAPSVGMAYSNSLDTPDFRMEFRSCERSSLDNKHKQTYSDIKFRCNRTNNVVLCNVLNDNEVEYPLYFLKHAGLDYDLYFETDDGKEKVSVDQKKALYTKVTNKEKLECSGIFFDSNEASRVMILDVSKGILNITNTVLEGYKR